MPTARQAISGLDKVRVELWFEQEPELLWSDLAYFFDTMHDAYMACAAVARNNPDVTLEQKAQWGEDVIVDELVALSHRQESQSFERAIEIEQITYQSPLYIAIVCLAAPIVLSVSLAGGKVEIDPTQGKIKAHLPGVAKSLKLLLDAFDRIRRR